MESRTRVFLREYARGSRAALPSAIVFVLVLIAAGLAQAHTFTVLYTFTNTANGEQPDASLIQDAAGNLYGTTQYGGRRGGYGTVFKLDTSGKETVLRSFAGTPDAEDPYSGLTLDKAGNFYGTTLYGGTGGGFGTVFKLHPNGKETILHILRARRMEKIRAQFWFETLRAIFTGRRSMAARMAASEPCSSSMRRAH